MEFKLGVHSSLVNISTPWDFKIDLDAENLSRSMINFMIENHGIGLAANQIGITKRVFVMGSYNIPNFPLPFAVFNPTILHQSGEKELDKEGCLSYPDLWLSVKRSKFIVVEYQNDKGDTMIQEMSGLIARCFQHEYDHLDGVCFVDKVSQMKLNLAMKKIRKRK